MRWSLAELAAATGGEVCGGDPDILVDGLSTDSRSLEAGQLFVALRAGRDGHGFVGAALAAGAGALLVDRAWAVSGVAGRAGLPAPTVVVADTAAALLDIGAAARRRIAGPVVGITGSVGKTSTKDLAAAALRSTLRVAASEKSFNNEIGVPLTLANSPEPVDAAVVEMGARGPGHITRLCRVARPTIGVVTAVAAAHTETFGGLAGVAAAKGELVEALPPGGTAVLNGDDPLVRAMASRGAAPALLYSVGAAGGAALGRASGARAALAAASTFASAASVASSAGTDVVAEDVRLDEDLRPTFRAATPWGRVEVHLEARGLHQAGNALAALAVAGAVGVDLEAAAAALRTATLSPWRMEVHRIAGGALVINDAYNANPASVAAALRSLAAVPARRRVAVLGLMAELGEHSASEHLEVAALAGELGIEVVAVGTADYGLSAVPAGEVPGLLGPLGSGDAVLVKGSRVAGLEVLAGRLAGEA